MRSVMFESILPLAAGLAAWGLGLAGVVRAKPSLLSFAFCALALWCVPAALEGMAAANDISALLDTIGGYRFAANTLLAGTAVCGFLAWGRRQLRKGGRR